MKTLLAWIELLPRIIDLVVTVESKIPIPGSGKEKLDLVLALLSLFYEGVGAVKELSWDRLIVLVPKAVALFVDLANKLGLFKHAGVPAVQPVP